MAVWRNADTYRGRSSVRTWLFGVARRQAHNALRSRTPLLAGEEELDSLPTSEPEPEDALLAGAHREELADRIGNLTPAHREVVVLIFLQELSYQETAEVLSIPIGTVKSRISNAKRALRILLQAPKERER